MGALHGWTTCPRCGARLDGDDGRLACDACGSVYYANSAPTVSALVEDEQGRLLLGRRAIDPYRGLWDTLGGFLHEGEDVLDGLRREVREETGLEVEPVRFFGAWGDRYGDGPTAVHTLNLFWLVRVVGGVERAADDVSELAWFAVDALPASAELAFTRVADVVSAWRTDRLGRALPNG
jgi:ADP-ribose pyrophosphatase YjhB (NUDIX family)